MFAPRFRTAVAALLGAVLVTSVIQSVPASADTVLPTPLKVNFQTSTTATPAGYTGDFGQAYDATRGYGWYVQGGTSALDLTKNGRERNAIADKTLDTFVQMQSNATTDNPTPGAWKAAVANGTYTVSVAAGDPSYTNSHHIINVEGTTLLDFTPSASITNKAATGTVTVTDGFLNVDAIGGTNTKIDYVTASPVAASTPTVTSVSPTNGATNVSVSTPVTLTLSANVDPTTAAVQLTDSSNAAVAGSTTSSTNTVTFTPNAALVGGTTYTVKTSSTMKDTSGNTFAPFTSTFTTSAPAPSSGGLKVNFGTATTAAIAGYKLDSGQAYDATRGYGWVAQSSGAPLDLTTNTRERNVVADKRMDTFVMPQSKATGSNLTVGAWKAPIANGSYTITVGVGDPSYIDSVDVVNVEGTQIANFTPTTGATQTTATGTVTVTDGVLNVDEVGGTNTKIDYIDVVPQGTTAPTPTVTVTPSGTTDTTGAYVDSATVTISASETGGTIAGTTYKLDGGPVTNYTSPFSVTTVGSHSVVATTTDANGATASATANFSVVSSTNPGPPGTTTAHYEFGAQTTTPVSGYVLDYGLPFDATRGYGWEDGGSFAPLSYVGNGRDRGVNSNKLLDRLISNQLASQSAGNHTWGRWEAAVTNGSYNVTIGVGDPSYIDSHDVYRAEGQVVVDFMPTAASKQTVTTATVTVTDGLLTLDSIGGTNSKIDYIDIVPSGTVTPPADTTPPTVSVGVSGTTNPQGAYLDSATVAISASDTGSGVKSISYSLDGAAAVTYTAAFQVNTLGAHTVSSTATDNSNNTSAPVTKQFTIASSTGASPQPTSLVVTSPQDNLGLGSRMVFSTVKNESRPGESLTLTNKGTTALNVTGLSATLNFQLCAGQATAFSIAGGATAAVCVQYRPTVDAVLKGSQVDQGTLTIRSNDATVPNFVVTLGGLNAENYESFHEPDLQQMFDTLGYTDNVVVSDKPQGNSISSSSAAIGDEVLAPYFNRLDSSKPVQLVPIAHYSGKSTPDSNNFGWYNYGSGTNNYLYCFPGGNTGTSDGYGQNQLLLPTIKQCAGTTGTMAFNPAGSFGIVDQYPGYTDYSDDAKNGAKWHNQRMYPAKDANGKAIAGAYLVGIDIGGVANNPAKNWDYQDFAFLLLNATPDTTKTQPITGVQAQTLSGFNGSNGGVAGTGFTSTQGALNSSLISTSGGNLQIKTSLDSNTSHTNALQIGVNAGDKFRITSRLVGPFDAINAGEEQQGIFWGPDATHYAKAEVESQSGVRYVSLYVYNGGTTKLQSVILPDATGSNNASTIDLRINVDPAPQDYVNYPPPSVTASFSVNGGAFSPIGSAVALPTGWVTANTPAGVMTSNQGSGGSQFTATYNSFVVARDF